MKHIRCVSLAPPRAPLKLSLLHWKGVSHCLKGRLNTDTSPQKFWTTFLANDLTENFKKSAVASTIAIPLPLCFSCFVLLRRFRENLTKPFYFYLSRTCDSPGGTPSVISLVLRANGAFLVMRRCQVMLHVAWLIHHFSLIKCPILYLVALSIRTPNSTSH